MSTIKTNQITTITGTELTLSARVKMIGDGATVPTNAEHLCRKDYVDLHSRIGATVSFSMAFGTGYDGSTTFGFTHTASSNAVTFPTGSWTGWVNTKDASNLTTTTAFSSASGLQSPTWTSSPAIFCLTRVS